MNNDPGNSPDRESSPERKSELRERVHTLLRTADDVIHDQYEQDDDGTMKYSLELQFETSPNSDLRKQGFTSGLVQRSEACVLQGVYHPEMTIIRLYSIGAHTGSLMYDMYEDTNGYPEIVQTTRSVVDEEGAVQLEKMPFSDARAEELDTILSAIERDTAQGS